ncbi:MAG: Hsp20/alpha crystallin family protein [Meiothermus sp.]|uniref:Hsp20/alpha crystallin family protein n=1 Tax=Meiothermus sp. TaxID=1955249 RepID=UPI0025E98BD5|nr:Hsp20/alpha crystallin family protein [Meiothermus sp.]MCS7059144.1 Hsp20/alpha crystallin family protein [Meiothermus sp.]MCS7195484.1 Hsp20/alpha crystallin family protein [Meiothermus sp.]MCX7741205.1 Hsp20/alpha crystallin family protein [Meiothermus sp.]MDW8090412.1 Hsp20/alpha crystallin family protein [Meiothermus sp.]MDW8481086.1 Hsp20/alpha crystallin family protein [Meiothermus sp.]
MAIERYDALEQLQRIRQQLDELSRRFSSQEALGEWVPPVDILDEGDRYRILVDVAGVKNDDLELQEQGQTITLAGVRHPLEGRYIRQERPLGLFRRTLSLPEPIVPNKAQASLKGGVLELVLLKARKPARKGKK